MNVKPVEQVGELPRCLAWRVSSDLLTEFGDPSSFQFFLSFHFPSPTLLSYLTHPNVMSSSDEEAVHRPGRNAANQSPDPSDAGDDSGAENRGTGGDDLMDDDADLFGSDGSDGGFDNIE